MNLTLRDDFRSKLVEKLQEILRKVEITSNCYLDSKPFYELKLLEDELRRKKDLWEKCEKLISDEPLIDFFFEKIDQVLKTTREFKSEEPPFLLNSLDEYKDVNTVVESLVSEFETLPKEYKIFIELPLSLGYEFDFALNKERYEFSDYFAFISIDEKHKISFPEVLVENPQRKSFSLFLSNTPREIPLYWNENQTYIELTCLGYVGIWADTTPIKKSKLMIRSFFGLGYALGLFEKSFSFGQSESYLAIYEKTTSDWSPQKTRKFSTEISRGMDSFRIGKLNSSRLFRKGTNPLIHKLNKIKFVFQNESDNESLMRAAQWLFDSFCGDDELLSFVKATVCLEILLGDKKTSEEVGLNKLLANRCAYLISFSKKDREKILREFSEIYDTRSKIVHTGKNHLTSEERKSLYKLRSFCCRVITREIDLLITDK